MMKRNIFNIPKLFFLSKSSIFASRFCFSKICCNDILIQASSQLKQIPKDPFSLWKLPERKEGKLITGLHVRNSLTNCTLVEFIPQKGKQIHIYNCGPTVYDHSHLGHARTYIGADMIRKILSRYFGYDVFYCQNITDIDDKIITKSNQEGEDFTSLARKWEIDYWKDMESLNIEKPDVIVRVSEYIPEIITYIQKIIDNGYAYVVDGSVYFEVDKFHAQENHCYAKLEPQSVNDNFKLEEGEGALGVKEVSKKSQKDFALWKASKPKEPKWSSPWGEGRPGWHIECSTMASEILGYPIDIHMGGQDLKFPHHDNEMAQSEAYYNKQEVQNQWVNYFLHTGHLHIEGLKMSKSLKNFITIKQLVLNFNPRVLRLLFMKQNYDAVMDYTADSVKEAQFKDRRFQELFNTMNAVLLQSDINSPQRWGKREFQLREEFEERQARIHQHLKKNFNVPEVIKEIDELATSINIYLKSTPKVHLILQSIFNYIKFIFSCFGLNYEQVIPQLSKDDPFVQIMNLISSLRDQIRTNLKNLTTVSQLATQIQSDLNVLLQKSQGNLSSEAILLGKIGSNFSGQLLSSVNQNQIEKLGKICDSLRDEDLFNIGIRIDDGKPGERSLWIVVGKDALIREREEKQLREKQKAEEKKKKDEEKIKIMKVKPQDLFKNDPLYARFQFDDQGVPTHDENGKELKEKAKVSFRKKFEAQKKIYEQYLTSASSK